MYYIQNIGLTKCFNLSSACSGRYTIPCTFYTIRIKERFYNTVKYLKIVTCYFQLISQFNNSFNIVPY